MDHERPGAAMYFSPCAVERWESGRLYELLGIRIFKRYLPSSGDIVSRWRGRRRIHGSGKTLLTSLEDREAFTRKYELRHIYGGIMMQALSIVSVFVWAKGNIVILTLANLVINGYPIFLQRYNRVRIREIIRRQLAKTTAMAEPSDPPKSPVGREFEL